MVIQGADINFQSQNKDIKPERHWHWRLLTMTSSPPLGRYCTVKV